MTSDRCWRRVLIAGAVAAAAAYLAACQGSGYGGVSPDEPPGVSPDEPPGSLNDRPGVSPGEPPASRPPR